MHIAFVSPQNAHDIATWSGIPYTVSRTLERHVDRVSYVTPLPMPRSLRQITRVVRHRLRGELYHRQHSAEASRMMGAAMQRQIEQIRPDAVLAPTTLPFAFADLDVPVATWTDATFESNMEFYGGYSDLPEAFVAEANDVETRALSRIQLACFAADYAADSARDYYGVPAERVHTIPYGANLSAVPSADDVEAAIAGRPTSPCRLLFIGTDWYRKGGDVAVRTLDRLRDAGLDAELHVVGPTDVPEADGHAHVHALGFVDKRTAEGRARFDRLLLDSTLFLLPTRVEAFGCVFCEASAYGVPSVTTAVGGTPTAVRHGENGLLLPGRSGPDALARAVLDLMGDDARYRALCRSSRQRYESELNWDTSVAQIVEALRACL